MLNYCWHLLTSLLLLSGSARSAPAPAASYTVRTWGVEDGLPQSAVLSLTQTRDGYLWVGTLDGLARFDGTRFATYREANTPGLTSSRILKLFEDNQQNLWIGTETAGIFLVKDGRVLSLDIGRGSRQGRLMSVSQDLSGAVWLYTGDGQLCRYQSNRVDVWKAGVSEASNCRAVITENTGTTWIGSDWTLTAIGPVPPGPVLALPVISEYQYPAIRKLDALLASKSGGHWRLVNNRIQKWTGDQQQLDLGAYPWSNSVPVTAVSEDSAGNLVVGTHGDGVFWFDAAGGFTHLNAQDLGNAFVLSLLVDREGSLWVGSNGGGLARVRKRILEVVEISRGSTVQSTVEDRAGGIWIGYNSQRIDNWNDGRALVFTNFHSELNAVLPRPEWFVRSVYVDAQGQTWAGTLNGGLLRLTDGTFRQVAGPELVRRDISAIHQDNTGRLWFGTAAGLVCRDGSEWKTFTDTLGLSANSIRAITHDKAGTIWVGTESGGLNRLREGKWEVFGKTNGLPSNNVSSLLVDEAGWLWIGTASGLALARDGKWFSFAGRLGPAADSVAWLLDDKQGFLWIGTTAGLVRVARQQLADVADGKTSAASPRLYGTADGLPSPECTQGSQPAATLSAANRVFFPTTKGLATAELNLLRPNTNPPPVLIEAVWIDGMVQGDNGLRQDPPKSVTIPPGNHALEVRYTSLNLASPEKARFKYRLRGHDPDWTEVESFRRLVRYPRLPPGDYLFEVSAANEDGVWSPSATSLAVEVLPPFYRTWWFISLTTLCVLGLIVGSVHYISTQKLQQQLSAMRQQEALEKERARIARDLHDQLGANLTQVALLGELAETDKDLPEEVEGHARQISQTARDTTRALDEIVWTVNPMNDTLDGLINYICKYAQEYLALASLRYRLEVPPQLPATPISPELRHNVFLAAKEAVNNVVKHSGASSAWLRLELHPDQFTLEIEDNGRGIAPSDDSKGRNGLRNMRRRMQDVGGSFEATAGREGGTRVRLTAPIGTPKPARTPDGKNSV